LRYISDLNTTIARSPYIMSEPRDNFAIDYNIKCIY